MSRIREKAICANCKGKGHVFNSLYIGFAVIGWILALVETNNKSGVTRIICDHCNGRGWL